MSLPPFAMKARTGGHPMHLRDYAPQDHAELGRAALAGFGQFKGAYADWPAMAAGVSRMGDLAGTGEIVVAEDEGRIVGGVAYVGPPKPKAPFFDPVWPVVRMLVVAPSARGRGLGRRLTEACVERARRDGASVIALHTTPIMTVALPRYLCMGFVKVGDAPEIHGVPYGVYPKTLG